MSEVNEKIPGKVIVLGLLFLTIVALMVWMEIKPEAPPEPMPVIHSEALEPATAKMAEPATQPQEISETQKHFGQLIEDFKSSAPTQADLQKLTAQQVHYTPEVIFKSALRLGDIAQAIADHKDLAAAGLKFYRECAENSASPNSLRASCYVRHEKLIESSGLIEPSLSKDSQVSDHVKSLAQKL